MTPLLPIPSQCNLIKAPAPALLAISALSLLEIFTSLVVRIITTLYPLDCNTSLSFKLTLRVVWYSGIRVAVPVAPPATLAFCVEAPGPIGSNCELPLA